VHVVLIEPDRLQAKVVATALERHGHTASHAASAQAAVQAADEQTPDVVILELQLPQHNGVEFLYEFRSYSEWLTIPVVLYTYLPPRELARAATLYKQLGVAKTLHKPETSLAMLCNAVAQAQVVTVP